MPIRRAAGDGSTTESSDRPWWAGSPTATPAVLYQNVDRTCRYLTTRDGTRLAADVYLPVGVPADTLLPTVVSFTPYTRDTEFRIPGTSKAIEFLGKAAPEWGPRFARHGYAYLAIEIRGAGASFGSKTSIFSDSLAEDGADVLDWIVEQDWSNGSVGATGISAVGLTSMMLAAGKPEALKAIAPRFTVFDIFDSIHPGGLLTNRFVSDIGKSLRAMDSNRLHEAIDSPALRAVMRLLIKGTRGTDDDRDGSLLAAAVAEHQKNEMFDQDIAKVRRRDDRLSSSSRPATLDTQSPFSLLADIEASGVAVYAYAGWFDGAFQRDLIHLYLNATNPANRLVLGPWAHGAQFYSSPIVSDKKRLSDFPQAEELVRFFDLHLRGVDHGVSAEDPVHYFTMVEERWKSSKSWPPPGTSTLSLHLSAGGSLSSDPATASATERYAVDQTATTGIWSRQGKHLTGGKGPANYPNRQVEDRKLLCFDSAPLDADLEVTGHPILSLALSCDTEDAALFAYLEDVAPDGSVHYITEAGLRLSVRREDDDPPYRRLGVWRRGAAADFEPVTPGKVMVLHLDLLPTSWLFRAGHTVRLAIGGADVDNFVMVPESGTSPNFTVHHGGDNLSRLDLPVMPATDIAVGGS